MRPLHTLGSKWGGGLSLISLVACDYLATARQRWQETIANFLRQPSAIDATIGCGPRASPQVGATRGCLGLD